jgi:hypothetical protein
MKTRNSTPVVVKLLVQRRMKNRHGREETLTKEGLYEVYSTCGKSQVIVVPCPHIIVQPAKNS